MGAENMKQISDIKWVYLVICWMASIMLIAQITTKNWIILPIFIGGFIILFAILPIIQIMKNNDLNSEQEGSNED